MRRAFTLVEVIVVLAIILTVAAIMTPALITARRSAQVTASAGRLKQLLTAVDLYREDNEMSGWGADSYPDRSIVYSTYLGFGKDFFRSPCGYVEGVESNLSRLSYQYTVDGSEFIREYFGRQQERSLLIRDPHCAGSVEEWNGPMMTKRFLGTLTGGRLVNRLARGEVSDHDLWSSL